MAQGTSPEGTSHKIGAKHLSGDPMKAEWKKCMEDANAYQ
jgi:hypothetical protein